MHRFILPNWLRSEAIFWSVRFGAGGKWRRWRGPGPTRPRARFDASSSPQPADLYRTTNLARISSHARAVDAGSAHRPDATFYSPEGLVPCAIPRRGAACIPGALGFEFDWTHADFELGGVAFQHVAARVKGNVLSLCEPTRSYKVT
jgi:hypothetical protein